MKTGYISDFDLLEEIAEVISKAKNLVAFTGAGISAESGIPTFRDAGGLWEKYDPNDIATVGGLTKYVQKNPHAITELIEDIISVFDKAEPHQGHFALAELEKLGILKTVVTQNIDDLHREAGNQKVIEVHGNIFRLSCFTCGKKFYISRREIIQKYREFTKSTSHITLDSLYNSLPDCDCGGKARFDVVMFGEPVQDMDSAMNEASMADVMLTLGTSGVVYPAAYVPFEAKRYGAKVIEINPHDSNFYQINDYLIVAKVGEALPHILNEVKKRRK